MDATNRSSHTPVRFAAAIIISFVAFYAVSFIFLYALQEVAQFSFSPSRLPALCVSSVIALLGIAGSYVGALCVKREVRSLAFALLLSMQLIYSGIYIVLSLRGAYVPAIGGANGSIKGWMWAPPGLAFPSTRIWIFAPLWLFDTQYWHNDGSGNSGPRRAQNAAPPNFSLHWTGSSRFSLVSMTTALAAAPGQ